MTIVDYFTAQLGKNYYLSTCNCVAKMDFKMPAPKVAMIQIPVHKGLLWPSTKPKHVTVTKSSQSLLFNYVETHKTLYRT
jgi:hypothetical protein